MIIPLLLGLPLSAILLLTACDPGIRGESPVREEPPAPVFAPPPLELTVQATARVRAGGSLPVRLVARNTGDRPLVLQTGDSASTFDFVITGPEGAEVWSRIKGMDAIPLVLIERTLLPGQAITFADLWDLRDNHGRLVPPGRYTVHALLDADTMPHRLWKTAPRHIVVTRD